MPWSLYLLRCSDSSLYTGITTDLTLRLARHNAGTASKYTRSRLPVVLVFSKRMRSESAARKREAAVKGMTREEKEAMIAKRP